MFKKKKTEKVPFSCDFSLSNLESTALFFASTAIHAISQCPRQISHIRAECEYLGYSEKHEKIVSFTIKGSHETCFEFHITLEARSSLTTPIPHVDPLKNMLQYYGLHRILWDIVSWDDPKENGFLVANNYLSHENALPEYTLYNMFGQIIKDDSDRLERLKTIMNNS